MKRLNSLEFKVYFTIVIIGVVVLSLQLLLFNSIDPLYILLSSIAAFLTAGLLISKFVVFSKLENLNKLIDAFKNNLDTGKRLKIEGENEFKEIIGKINEVLEDSEKSSGNLEIFKVAIENSSDQVVIADPEGIVQYSNPATERLTGFKKEEIIGNNPRLWGGQMSPDFYKKMWNTIKFQKKVFEGELLNKKKDGTRYFVKSRIEPILDKNGNLKQFIAVERDMTFEKKNTEIMVRLEKEVLFSKQSRLALANILEDTKKLEDQLQLEKIGVEKKIEERTDQLQKEKTKLFASISSLPLGFIMIDNLHNVLFTNNKALEILKLTKEGVKTFDDILNRFSKDSLIFKMHEDYHKEKHPIGKKGEVLFGSKNLMISLIPITNGDENLGNITLIDDITEAKILERSKDEFFSIASHELRTPLTAIRGNVSLIKQYYSDKVKDEDLRSMIDDIGESSIRLIKIVNDFLNMSRLEMGKIQFKKEKVNLVKLVEGVIREYEATGNVKQINLRFIHPKAEVPNALGDMDKSREIVVNLIGNSLKYTEKGEIVVTLEENSGFVKVLVKDTGKGISPENQTLLFHKFQQAGTNIFTRDSSQSTGLGLYISKRMAEAMNGTVALDHSTVGVGSTFSFSLPVVNEISQTQPQNGLIGHTMPMAQSN